MINCIKIIKNHIKIIKILICLTFIFLSAVDFVFAQTTAASTYGAVKIEQSHGTVNLAPGKAITVWVKFKNTGTKSWLNSGTNAVVLKATDSGAKQSQFRHQFWPGPFTATKMSETEVKSGQTGTFRFALQAPNTAGSYAAKFNLYAGSSLVKGGQMEISVKVNQQSTVSNQQPITGDKGQETSNQIQTTSDLNLTEPLIRIGLYDTTQPIKIAASGGYEIRDKDNNLLMTLTAGEESEAEFNFSTQKYFLNIGNRRVLMTDSYFKFVPKSGSILKITSYENRPAWNQNLNDNEFRGNLEFRYNPKTQKLWIIDELPMEDYLKGMAEAHNDSPLEHLKAMSIAERTYALYYYLHPTKHADEDFLLTPTEYDQVYRGYGTEKRLNNVVTAAIATRGTVVTYNNEVAITPYFTQSDGRTRSWSEVWSGEKPWLIGKPDSDCEGLALLGHGVGMSAAGGKAMGERGAIFEEILKYYYTGIEIQKIY